MILNRLITNLFIDIKNRLYYIIDDKNMFFYNKKSYDKCMRELIELLRITLAKIEDIYFKYILSVKLQKHYNTL